LPIFVLLPSAKFDFNATSVGKWMEKSWLQLINRRISGSCHRKLLIVLLEKYLSQLRKPTLLIDFLIGSLGLGGASALLALQAISVLVTKHNL